MSTGTLTSFWHVDGHTDVVLACRRAHLHRFGMSTGTICYVDGHIYFTLYYSPFPTYFLATQRVVLACRWAHVRRFGMLTGTFWHVDEHIYYFNLFYTLLCVLSICYFSFPTYFLASWGVVVACRWAHFGMSTDTFITSLHFTILPFQPTFWHRGRPFGMLTGTFTIFPFQPTLASGVGLTFFGFRHRDYIYRNAVRSSLALPHICYAMRSSLVLAHRHDATLSDLLLALALMMMFTMMKKKKMMITMMVPMMMMMMVMMMMMEDDDGDDNDDDDGDDDDDEVDDQNVEDHDGDNHDHDDNSNDDDDEEDHDDVDDDDDFGVTGEMTLESQTSRIWSHKRDIAR